MGILKDVMLASAFVLLLWAPLGRLVLRRICPNEISESQSIAMAIGMGLWGMFILLIGLPGLLHPVAIITVMALAIVLLRQHLSFRTPSAFWADLGLGSTGERALIASFAALSGVYFVLVLGSALAPELSFDALNVHLPYSRDAAAARGVTFVPNNWSSIMPALPLMSYITAFLVSGEGLAKLFNVTCYLACGGVVCFFARRRWGWFHGVAAATMFWSCPVVLYEATTALIDLPLTLYSAIAALSLLEWTRKEDPAYLQLSAASLGLAMGCKYHAAFWIPPVACILIWHALLVLKWPLQKVVAAIFRFVLVVGLLFLPWMLRAWYYTGNPVFPLANDIYESPYFTRAMEEAARAAYANEGVGRSWHDLVSLPWTVTFHPGPFRGTTGVILFVGTVLALVRIRRREMVYGLFLACAYFYTWALTAQEIRYLLPLVPLLSLLAAAGILGSRSLDCAANGNRIRTGAVLRWGRCGGSLLLLGGAALGLPPVYGRWVKDWTYWHSYKSPFPYLLGRESLQDFLSRDVPSIFVYDYINAHLSSRDRILLLNDHAQFYSKVPTLYSFTLEGEEILRETSEVGVLRRLKESRITHVLLNYNGIAPLPGVTPREGVYFFLDRQFQEKHLEAIHSRNNVVLYKVRVI